MIRDVYKGRLSVGDALAARDLKLIYDRSIEAVLDLAANEPPAVLGRDIIYCRFPLADDESNEDRIIASAMVCLRSLLDQEYRTLVACGAGMSRSLLMAASVISSRTKTPLRVCLEEIASDAPRDVSPALFTSVARVHERLAQE